MLGEVTIEGCGRHIHRVGYHVGFVSCSAGDAWTFYYGSIRHKEITEMMHVLQESVRKTTSPTKYCSILHLGVIKAVVHACILRARTDGWSLLLAYASTCGLNILVALRRWVGARFGVQVEVPIDFQWSFRQILI